MAILIAASLPAGIVDRILATVGIQAITLGQVDKANRLEMFFNRQPVEKLAPARLRPVASRLIDQLLLRQEMEASRFPATPAAQVDERLTVLKKEYEGEEGFGKALAKYGLNEADVRTHIQSQLDVLRFIGLRFRPMVTVEQADIERYYGETLIPRLRAQGASQVPPLAEVQDRLEAIITQERINEMYARWLEDMRTQAGIQYR